MQPAGNLALWQRGKVAIGRLWRHGEASSAVWGIADQALVSLANFVTMLLLARSLEPSAFGSFVVVFTLLLFASSLQTTLITRPHNVLAAPMSGEGYEAYTSGAATAQIGLATVFAGLALLIALAARWLGAGIAPLLLVVPVAVFAGQLQEFVRQTQYTRRRPSRAFAYDLVRYGGTTLAVMVLWRFGELTGESALYAMALTAAVSALYGARELQQPLGAWREALSRNWELVRWTLPDCLGQWLSHEAYPLLVAALAGVAGTGAMKAVQTLVAPSHVVMNAFEAYVVPRAARAAEQGGKTAMLSVLLPAAVLAAQPVIGFWLAISLLAPQLMSAVYGPAYAAYAPMVWLVALGYFAMYLVQVSSLGLVALGEVRALFLGRTAGIVLTLTAGAAVVWQWGAYGALAGNAVAMGLMALLLAWQLVRAREQASWVSPHPFDRLRAGSNPLPEGEGLELRADVDAVPSTDASSSTGSGPSRASGRAVATAEHSYPNPLPKSDGADVEALSARAVLEARLARSKATTEGVATV